MSVVWRMVVVTKYVSTNMDRLYAGVIKGMNFKVTRKHAQVNHIVNTFYQFIYLQLSIPMFNM